MTHSHRIRLTVIAATLTFASVAYAQLPSPLSNPVFGFALPGVPVAAANAASAGVALADRWLGETPYENPAFAPPKGFTLEASPLFQRVNRQDVVSINRSTTQTVGYPDAAGGMLAYGTGRVGLALYAWQPVLRLEQMNYEFGPLATPGQMDQQALQRELRVGAAVSYPVSEELRVGVAGEFVRRDDSYETHEQSGSPSAGDRVLAFNGNALGASVGVRYTKDAGQPWASELGAALHWQQEIEVTGTYQEQLTAGDSTGTVSAKLESALSGGFSGRVNVAPSTWVVAGVSSRSSEAWSGFGVWSDAALGVGVGLVWKDAELPYGFRFGVGRESSPGALETKSGLASVGFTYVSKGLVLDLGVLHRNLARDGFPRSSDDRILGSVRVAF
ncbi:MAG: hypothetical protein RL760_206 [Candidatus Eisenbacteria bacterium]|jgi:hypothetical protein